MPFHIAFGMTSQEIERFTLSDADRRAWAIMLAEMEGLDFDWDSLRPRKK